MEHIVIDGNSTDNIPYTIKLYDYDNLIWISEPDTGIYNAMNKIVFGMAKGKYLLFLNSGDIFNSNVLTNVTHIFKRIFYTFR